VNLLLQFLNNGLREYLFEINEQTGMVKMQDSFQIIETNQWIKYFLEKDTINNLVFNLPHGTPYIVIRYRQNTNLYMKLLDNAIGNNHYQVVTLFLFVIGGFIYDTAYYLSHGIPIILGTFLRHSYSIHVISGKENMKDQNHLLK
jgi:hypothetical protein